MEKRRVVVWTSEHLLVFFSPNGPNDYNVVQTSLKPPNAHYIGFGEQGGQCLIKN